MAIHTTCPGCQSEYDLPDDLMGKKARCKKCQAFFVIGSSAPVVSVASEPVEVIEEAPRKPVVEVMESAPARRPLPSSRRPKRESSGSSALMVVGIVLLALIVLGGAGGIVWMAMNVLGEERADTRSRPAVAATKPQPAPVEKKTSEPPALVTSPKPPADGWYKELEPRVFTPRDFDLVSQRAGDSAKLADRTISAEVLQKVKSATAFIRVTRDDGGGSGSGFLVWVDPARREGHVVTNAHVVGMLHPQAKHPSRVEVVFNSGETNERTLPGYLLGVDRGADLALVRVRADKLPEPLEVEASANLLVTQPLWIFGFPLGEQLGKNITVTDTTVTSLRRDPQGLMQQVQVNGGMNRGNSGGPVVDVRGAVVGVAVRMRLDPGLGANFNTQIHMAVPTEQVRRLLDGQVLDVSLGPVRQDKDGYKVAVFAELHDPLKRLKTVAIEWWTGAAGPPRDGGYDKPGPKEGDSQRTAIELKNGRGELVLSAREADKVYWLQVRSTNAAGQTTWSKARVLEPLPVEAKRTRLEVRHKADSRSTLRLSQTLVLRLHDRDGGEHRLAARVGADLDESTRAVDAQGSADVRLQYRSLQRSFTVDDNPISARDRLNQMGGDIRRIVNDMRIDRFGDVLSIKQDLEKVTANNRTELGRASKHIQKCLEVLAIPLPGMEIEPGQAWKVRAGVPFDVSTPALPSDQSDEDVVPDGTNTVGDLDFVCTYMGTRQREGRAEAVLAIEGKVVHAGMPEDEEAIAIGSVAGHALFDVGSGQLSLVRLSIEIENLNVPIPQVALRAQAAVDLRLQRTPIVAGK